MEDSEIITMLENRDESAIDGIRQKYSAYLFSIANNILGNALDAEECVSTSYYRVWEAIPPGKPASLSLYLAKIVRNCALDVMKERKAEKRKGEERALPLEELEGVIPTSSGPEEALDAEILKSAVSAFLRKCPEKQRQIFILRYYFFDPVKEIAAVCGMSESAVKVTLFRMKSKLREYLRKEGISV